MPWGIAHSGTSGHPVTFTTDHSWYSGGSWSQPVFDSDYLIPFVVTFNTQNYLTFNDIEFKNMETSDGNGAIIWGVGAPHDIRITNCYIHGWNTTFMYDTFYGGVHLAGFGTVAMTNVIEDSILTNIEWTGIHQGGQATSDVAIIRRTLIHDVSAATTCCANTFDGGETYNVQYPSGNVAFELSGTYVHVNNLYMSAGNFGVDTCYVINSIIHDTGFGAANAYLNTGGGHTCYAYNNVFYGNMPASGAVNCDPLDNSTHLGGYCKVYNNVFYGVDFTETSTAINLDDRHISDSVTFQGFESKNNYFIGNGLSQDNANSSSVSGTITRTTNLPSSGGQNPTTATSEGYVAATLWAPIGGRGSTVRTGTDISSLVATDINGETRTAPLDIGAYEHPRTTYYASLATNTPAGSNSNAGTLAAPFETLNHCFAVLAAGDQCQVRAGTYNQGFLNIGTGYTALGTDFGDSEILVKPYNGETVVWRHNSEKTILTFHGGVTTHDHLFWHIQDIDFDGSTGYYPGSGTSGSLIDGDGEYVWIDGNRIHHGVNNGMQPEGDHWSVTDNEIDHNGTVVNTDGVQYHGVYTGGSYGIYDGNNVHDNSGSGIQVFQSASNSVSFNIVRNNVVYHNDQYDPNCGCYEISVGTGEGELVYNNIIYNFTIGAIQMDYRCGLYGVACAAYGNTIYSTSNRVGIRVGPDNLGTIIKNNIIRVPSGTTVSDSGSMTVSSNNVTADPSFTNVGSSDFSLQSGSVAIAANGFSGANLSSLCTGDNIALCSDINGTARGTTPDAGADQYSSGTPPSISGLAPSTGAQGALVAIAVTGASTNFSNGSTVCTVSGSDIVIIGTTASSATAGICTITIGSNAAVGARDVTMTTGGEVATATGGFTVILANARQFPLFRIH